MEQNRQLKTMLLDMLSWFHAFCQENDLRYYVLGGTMLGAVRHQGFIPWDDDVDVGMPRGDYRRLEELLKGRQKERYVLETPNSPNKDYFYPFAKLYDTETTLIENTRCKIKRGIYLDIFPLDGAGADAQSSAAHYAPIKKKLDFLLCMTTGLRRGRSFAKNGAVLLTRLIPNFLLDRKQYLRRLDSACGALDYDSCPWVGNFMGAWRQREIMPVSIMGTPTLYSFEGLQVYGAEDYEGYLTSLYGDWRKLPPEEKRVSHHDFLHCDLNTSYLR